ncbi:MAG: hypothetical protein LQ343_002488 [Gyalolechia ehrenbergii]|nr:MAG: hypothetical protein LQ343_002488 [Gyalolechia ehrenbergii]
MACRVPISHVAKAIRCLEEDGGVILTGFATPAEVKTVNDDAAPYLETVAEEVQPNNTAREKWLQRREVHQILNSFLKTISIPYNDQGRCVIETDPILSAAATMEISPGEKAQDLHRDDFIWQRTHTGSEDSHKRGSDTSMGIIVAGMETTMANGATAENQFLWWAKEEIRTWSTTAQRQAGYLLGNPFLGHCDETDPVKIFRASEAPTHRRAA